MIKSYKGIYPRISPSAFIEESAYIIGDVEIGDDASVWFYSVIRGDVHPIKIGRKTNIQDFCTVHATSGKYPVIVGDDVTVGHRAILHGCTVEDKCLIGMGAILLDGAVIEEGSIIGAGAVVSENMVIPSRSLAIGVPARVVKTLDDSRINDIQASAEAYRKHFSDYKK